MSNNGAVWCMVAGSMMSGSRGSGGSGIGSAPGQGYYLIPEEFLKMVNKTTFRLNLVFWVDIISFVFCLIFGMFFSSELILFRILTGVTGCVFFVSSVFLLYKGLFVEDITLDDCKDNIYFFVKDTENKDDVMKNVIKKNNVPDNYVLVRSK